MQTYVSLSLDNLNVLLINYSLNRLFVWNDDDS